MADWHSFMSKSSGSGHRRSVTVRDHEEFEEEDVWSFANGNEDSSPQMRKSEEYSSGSSSAWRLSTARMIRRTDTIPTAAQEADKVVQQSSAPVNIPDWSKIYGKNVNLGSSSSSRNGSWVDGHGTNGVSNGVGYINGDYRGYYDDDADNENDDDDGDMVPPHEWLARKLARNQISSFSVCEGIGRTLKGRDLSKVRNAILTKTGFLE